jgi:hypothetical protein
MSCNLEEPQQPPATTHEEKKIHINGSYLLQGAAAAAKHLHDTLAKTVQPQLFRSSEHKGQSKHYIILHIVVVHHFIVQKLTIQIHILLKCVILVHELFLGVSFRSMDF